MSFLSFRRRLQTIIAVWLAALLLGVSPGVTIAGSLTEITEFGSNPGNLRMLKYVPDGLLSPAPLVVALHGCMQNAASYGAESGWIELTEKWGFALLLPEQKGVSLSTPWWLANNAYACFNWFRHADITRDKGEAFSIRQMIETMTAHHNIDASRIYVTGLSAGGAMTAVMLATYPEVFAGGAILAGTPYRCALTSYWSIHCMKPGLDKNPDEWGNRVRAASNHAGPWPAVSIWHGTRDKTVHITNARELVEQWTNVHGIDLVADVESTVKNHLHRVFQDADGNPRVESFLITGMAHGTPVDPGEAEHQCGMPGRFSLPAGICATFHIGKSWDLDTTE